MWCTKCSGRLKNFARSLRDLIRQYSDCCIPERHLSWVGSDFRGVFATFPWNTKTFSLGGLLDSGWDLLLPSWILTRCNNYPGEPNVFLGVWEIFVNCFLTPEKGNPNHCLFLTCCWKNDVSNKFHKVSGIPDNSVHLFKLLLKKLLCFKKRQEKQAPLLDCRRNFLLISGIFIRQVSNFLDFGRNFELISEFSVKKTDCSKRVCMFLLLNCWILAREFAFTLGSFNSIVSIYSYFEKTPNWFVDFLSGFGLFEKGRIFYS